MLVKFLCLLFAIVSITYASDTNFVVRECISVCADDMFDSSAEAIKKSYKPVRLFIDELKYDLPPDRQIKTISLKSCGIDDVSFKVIFDAILNLSVIKDHVEIIELSYNPIGMRCVDNIVQILNFPNLHYLNLTGTHFGLKRIEILARELLVRNVPLHKINKIIFIEKTYILAAENKVKIYNQLRDDGVLGDWAEAHRNFYKNIKSTDGFELSHLLDKMKI